MKLSMTVQLILVIVGIPDSEFPSAQVPKFPELQIPKFPELNLKEKKTGGATWERPYIHTNLVDLVYKFE